jgi:hypothetical protein
MPTLDEQIAQGLQDALDSGELKAAPSWGRPLDFGDGYDDTPPELRMPFKILKDAGVAPPEVETMRQIAALRERLHALDAANANAVAAPTQAAARSTAEAEVLGRRIAELQQHLALRLEHLRMTGSL